MLKPWRFATPSSVVSGKKMASLGILGSIAYDNIFTADSIPGYGERVSGRRLGKYVGGMAANQAIEAARYLDGVVIIGKVGGDPEGASLLQQLADRNVGTHLLMVDEQRATGQSYMYLVGDDYFSIVTPESNQQITPEETVRAVDALGNGILMASLEICVEAVLSALLRARDRNIETILIPSPPEVCTQELLKAADSLILNRREARMLLGLQGNTFEETKSELLKLEIRTHRLVITMGSEGAVMREGNQIYSSAPLPVTAVDSIGAGDAFSGAFVSALALGMPPQKALSMGCIAGGLTVSVVGAQASLHDMRKVMDLYHRNYSKLT
jgi:ribokinase